MTDPSVIHHNTVNLDQSTYLHSDEYTAIVGSAVVLRICVGRLLGVFARSDASNLCTDTILFVVRGKLQQTADAPLNLATTVPCFVLAVTAELDKWVSLQSFRLSLLAL